MNEREMALEKVNRALPVFERINELYCAANSLNQQTMTARVDEERFRQNTRRRANLNYLRTSTVVGLFIVAGLLYLIGRATGYRDFFTSIAMIVLIAGGWAGRRVSKKQLQEKHNQTETQIYAMKHQMEQISQDIYRVAMENQELISLMPRDYRYYDAVAFFENALANGRADSMKEAINLYEEYLHRQNMELNSRQVLEQSRMQSAMLSNIEQSSQEAAFNSAIAAGFSVLTYLK